MALNPALKLMVAEANAQNVGESPLIFTPSITAELARLGFEKATKRELREVIRRAMNEEHEVG